MRSGPPAYLTQQEENELEDFICNCAKVGYARTRLQVIALVQHVTKEKGLNVTVTSGWWESFRCRDPKVKLRTAEPVAYARVVSSSPAILDYYFDLLESTLEENGLTEKPCQIFNADESGMPLDPPSLNVVAPMGARHSRVDSTGDKAQISILACCNATGFTVPPMAIFDRKSLKPEMTIFLERCTACQPMGGWIQNTLNYGSNITSWHMPLRYILCCCSLMGTRFSHFQSGFVKKAVESRLSSSAGLHHTTHLTQPLDKGCFGPLKMYWREECQNYIACNPGRVVTRYQFSELFSRAWYKGMSMSNIMSGFRIFPFNRHVLRPCSEPQPRSVPEGSGLKYIPLFSSTPARDRSQAVTPSFSDVSFPDLFFPT